MRKSKWLLLALVFVMVFTLALSGCAKNEEPAPNDDSNVTENDNNEENANEEQDTSDEGGEKLAEEQVLRVNWGSEPPDLDPQTTTDQVSFWIINATLEGLVRLNPDGTVGKGLAKDWEISEDGLTYTFHLRDAKWSDGTPITAHDFEFSWKRALNPETAAQYAYQLYHIKNAKAYNTGEITDPSEVGITAVDDKTLKVELERPAPFFLSLTSFITYLPVQEAAIEKFGDEYATDPEKMVYSGPFKIGEWQHEQKLVLVKNENYWDADAVKLERIEGSMITDNNTRVNLYETGQLDMTGVPSEFLEKYQNTPEYQSLAEATTWYLQFNCEDKYFSNLNIRKAFAYATNSKAYVDNILADGSLVAEGLTPPLLPGKDGKEFAENRGAVLPKFNPEKAKEHFEKGLEELGITKEQFESEVTLVCGEGTWWSRTAQAVQQMWKQNLGVELGIEQMTFAMRLKRYNDKDYQITIAGWGGDYNDPMTFMDLFVTGGGNNDAYFSNEEYDRLIEIAQTGSGDERIDAMVDAEKILAEELPIFPMFHPARNFVQRPYVKGVARFPVGCDTEYKWAYILEH
ncbi:peptide ABC transporter substrate-binding protein [Caldisalinibacter kiritimatiensis]|uniref:Oligopeptide ABC transporter, periplasmic oligopeptide-binding protein OppA n=1 Tax=Caldisalinibacter kiritimatiensis TaxID=1304284 RepID=R1CP65_9FIRM|nr:peptide ABC transporter substrate-binding protein [Caldisalinibacter kiritimatiensis]EOD00476.1 Oligopeptide ABC transporter, periplasmic oligopeptide-binding protein OppA [Caldisalinibacter kiritimatiensis]